MKTFPPAHPLSNLDRPLTQAEHRQTVGDFYTAGGLELLLDLPLVKDSQVLDLGGHQGLWAIPIYQRFKCQLHICEPNLEFAQHLNQALPFARVYPIALSSRTNSTQILYKAGSRTSIFRPRNCSLEGERVPTLRASEFLKALPSINLMHVNVEGSEYYILPDLLDKELLRTTWLQIQFHLGAGPEGVDPFGFDPHTLRESIRNQLRKTHECLFDFPYVWECWKPS